MLCRAGPPYGARRPAAAGRQGCPGCRNGGSYGGGAGAWQLNDTEDLCGVVEYLERRVGGGSDTAPKVNPPARPQLPKGTLTGAKLSAAIAYMQVLSPPRCVTLPPCVTLPL